MPPALGSKHPKKPGIPRKDTPRAPKPKFVGTGRFSVPEQSSSYVRAHQMFVYSGRTAMNAEMAERLVAEGFREVKASTIARWRKLGDWQNTDPITPIHPKLGNDVSKAITARTVDDLAIVENTTHKLADLGTDWIHRIGEQIPNIKIETVEDMETAARTAREMLATLITMSKTVQDLRLLRISANFGNGEVIPPTKGDSAPAQAEPMDMDEMAKVIRRFERPAA